MKTTGKYSGISYDPDKQEEFYDQVSGSWSIRPKGTVETDGVNASTFTADQMDDAAKNGEAWAQETQGYYDPNRKLLGSSEKRNYDFSKGKSYQGTGYNPAPETGMTMDDDEQGTAAAKDTTNVGANKADKRSREDIRKMTSGLFDAYYNGDFGPSGSADAKNARNYFMLDSLLNGAKNWARKDQHYAENLSKALHGDAISAYDFDNESKSKWDQLREAAMNRYNAGQDALAKSDYDTAASIGTAEDKAQYAQEAGTQGLAQAAAGAQATEGAFDPVANAYASGDQEKVQAAIDAELKNPATQQKLQELEMKLKSATFDADVEASRIANTMTNQQIEMMKAQAALLGYQGDTQKVLRDFIVDLQQGKVDVGTVMALGGMALLNQLGINK